MRRLKYFKMYYLIFERPVRLVVVFENIPNSMRNRNFLHSWWGRVGAQSLEREKSYFFDVILLLQLLKENANRRGLLKFNPWKLILLPFHSLGLCSTSP